MVDSNDNTDLGGRPSVFCTAADNFLPDKIAMPKNIVTETQAQDLVKETLSQEFSHLGQDIEAIAKTLAAKFKGVFVKHED